MADQVLSEVSNKVLVAEGTVGYRRQVTVSDADEKPGHAVTGIGETAPEVDLRASTEELFGILDKAADTDIDTAYTAARGAKGVDCFIANSGAVVWVLYIANGGAIKAGNRLAGASEAGKFAIYAAAFGASYVEATVNAAANVIADGLPMAVEDLAADASNDKWLKAIL